MRSSSVQTGVYCVANVRGSETRRGGIDLAFVAFDSEKAVYVIATFAKQNASAFAAILSQSTNLQEFSFGCSKD
ncbi:hypothetical protein U8335_26435 [Roseiconus lacunae]|uniref:hypothetical protein n=1 Tax=Roseiconus lacunae TaxID=2605694 RepID=UPI003092459C|nr:hypothetical protein U8335_26435 [Stieleria sp. HD01]